MASIERTEPFVSPGPEGLQFEDPKPGEDDQEEQPSVVGDVEEVLEAGLPLTIGGCYPFWGTDRQGSPRVYHSPSLIQVPCQKPFNWTGHNVRQPSQVLCRSPSLAP